ncbi:MAG: DUF1801 domain-containing protein [Candidatus Marinimicrobia bacterium]|jgi:hypothetical protein|nr:DUF1801 domain-containing protein [Candidatus Neomarinimicrobiota bacterium]MBT3683609.1 DUF1801 domain-containing protein [Candidatus Neomarinimicrobiota bacterium]MBT3760388.1 DUF1801 domain-containing protein [Candidatus Neomarinimicrobiota bacterium]MBT3896534.1 DUF1801 domain-containing protein [Candidatus Neomarinimicrobiota bacterium]MBT4173552.1 DUF1801 domain-containing protein [Candidatus Neomarinimicrobiota bacterium]
MLTKQKNEIEELLHDFETVSPGLTEIIVFLRKIVLSFSPAIKEEIKYGGIVFIEHKQLICGIFLRTKFVTMEFGFGSEFTDEGNLLEGTGKFRRNQKFRKVEEIKTKHAKYFIGQALTDY